MTTVFPTLVAMAYISPMAAASDFLNKERSEWIEVQEEKNEGTVGGVDSLVLIDWL